MAAAVWSPEDAAFVVAAKGSHAARLDALGAAGRDGALRLDFEAAVFLADRGSLLLFADDVAADDGGNSAAGPPRSPPEEEGPASTAQQRRRRRRSRPCDDTDSGGARAAKRLVSLEEALQAMVHWGVPLQRYFVFCALARLGLVVKRHPAVWWLGGSGGGGGSSGEAAAVIAGGAQQQQQQQQQQEEQAQQHAWWPPRPPWLPESCDAASGAPRTPVASDLGAALRAKHPRLRPLPRVARGAAAAAAAGAGAAGGNESSDNGYSGMCGIAYDVFVPKPGIARRPPSAPAFRVAMQQRPGSGVGDAAFPSLAALLAMAEAGGVGVPVRLAVVEGGEPCFFEAAPGRLMDLLSPG